MGRREALKIKYLQLNRTFGIPCLVHANPKDKTFLSFLKHKKIFKPSDQENYCALRGTFFEKELGIDDCTWWSLGFHYNSLGEKYGVIFNLRHVDRSFEVFSQEVILQSIRITLRYWKDYDQAFLQTVLSSDRKLRKAIQLFYDTDKEGDGSLGEIWPVVKKFYSFCRVYPHIAVINRLVRRMRKRIRVNWFIKSNLRQNYNSTNFITTEIVCHRSVELDSKHLLGFYVAKGGLTHEIKENLRKFIWTAKRVETEKLILFDGHKKYRLLDAL